MFPDSFMTMYVDGIVLSDLCVWPTVEVIIHYNPRSGVSGDVTVPARVLAVDRIGSPSQELVTRRIVLWQSEAQLAYQCGAVIG
jgi:hypothetical protein